MADILVVIPTIIDSDYRYNLVKDLTLQDHVKNIILVDNGNNLEFSRLAQTEDEKIQVYKPSYNLNWLKSCNIGAKIAKNRNMDFVCFLNDDVELCSNFFSKMLESYTESCGVIGPSHTGFLNQHIEAGNKKTWKSSETDVELDFIDGTCMLIPMRTVNQVGVLDESFQIPNWGADLDYCYRIRQHGYKVIGSKRAALWHFNNGGGMSARIIYGSAKEWQRMGKKQLQRDMAKKYGEDWKTVHNFHHDLTV